MKIKNYDEIKCLVLDLVDSLYPNHECIVLTGSTLEPLYHRPQSDIDVVVVSKEFTGITSHVRRHRQKVIDITRVGYFQLPDLLIENCYNPTAILLTMLSTGKILRDRNDLGKTLITYTRELSTMGNLSYRSDAYSLTRSLVKLRKHLGKRLDRTFDFFLICDAARLLVQCHLFLSDGGHYMQESFRTVKHIDIADGNIGFAERIALTCRKAYRNNDKKLIECYVDHYIKALKRPHDDSYRSSRFIINIGLPTYLHDKTIKMLHERITGHTTLSAAYLYGYSTIKTSIYREGIVLMFDATKDRFDRHLVLHGIYDILIEETIAATSIDIIDDRYRHCRMPDTAVEHLIDGVLRSIYLDVQNYGIMLSPDKLAAVMVRMAAILGIEPQRRQRIMTLAAIAARPRNMITNNMLREQILRHNMHFKEEMTQVMNRAVSTTVTCDIELSECCNALSSAISAKSDIAIDPVSLHLFASVGLKPTYADICFLLSATAAFDFLHSKNKTSYLTTIGFMPEIAIPKQ